MRAMFVPGCALHVSPSRLSYPVTLHPNLLGRGQTRKARLGVVARCIVPRSAAGEVARRLGVARLLRRLNVCANRVVLSLRRCDHRHARRRHTHADDSQRTAAMRGRRKLFALNLQPTGRSARLGVRIACACGKLLRCGAAWMRPSPAVVRWRRCPPSAAHARAFALYPQKGLFVAATAVMKCAPRQTDRQKALLGSAARVRPHARTHEMHTHCGLRRRAV